MLGLSPYLNFNGTCEEAFDFYKSVLGGTIDSVNRYDAMPSEFPMREEDKKKIMHISMTIAQGIVLMGADVVSGMPPAPAESNIALSLHPDNEAEARKLFDALSTGGNVTMPLEKQFWGAFFGMFTDKYGISWMINSEIKE